MLAVAGKVLKIQLLSFLVHMGNCYVYHEALQDIPGLLLRKKHDSVNFSEIKLCFSIHRVSLRFL